MARNEKFQQLVKDVAFATLAHRQKKGQAGYVKVSIANVGSTKSAPFTSPGFDSLWFFSPLEFSVKWRFKQTESGWWSFTCWPSGSHNRSVHQWFYFPLRVYSWHTLICGLHKSPSSGFSSYHRSVRIRLKLDLENKFSLTSRSRD